MEMAISNSVVTVLPLDSGCFLTRDFSQSLSQIQAIIGLEFQNKSICEHAFTHGSKQGRGADYQRLEFLGDRVLSLVIAEALFKRFPAEAEGQLAAKLSQLVRMESCAAVGQSLGLDKFIIVGSVEKTKGVQRIASVVGDVVEALIGAIYLDVGFAKAEEFILKNWDEKLTKSPSELKDSKTFIQEWALARALPLPFYEVTGREGPEHAPVFTIQLRVGPYDVATGIGASKQSAEMAAALSFITREGLR
jgi:ribonuclease III